MAETSPIPILVAVIVLLAIGITLFFPNAPVSKDGFVLLIQNKDTIDSYFENGKLKQKLVEKINENTRNVPEQLFELFGNNNINLYLTFDDGLTDDYFATTKSNKLLEMREGVRSNADLEIRLKESTIDSLLESQKPFDDFIDAMNNGEINYKGLNTVGSIKGATVSVTMHLLGFAKSVSGFFSGLFGQ